MPEQMEPRAPWVPWVATSVALVVVAVGAYTIGANTGGTTGAPSRQVWADNDVQKLWAFFLIFLAFSGLRWTWWGPHWRYRLWRRHAYYRPWDPDPREAWEAWHRQAHRDMDSSAAPSSRATPPER